MTRWTIMSRARVAPGTNIEWHVAEGPDPGTNPDGIEVVRASTYEGAVSDIEKLCREVHRNHRAIDPYPCGMCRDVAERLDLTIYGGS
jgi:hypothetical protein